MLAILGAVAVTALVGAQEPTWLRDHAPDHEFLTLSDGLSDSTVFSIDQDDQGRIWFGTASGGANVYDGHRLRTHVHDADADSLSSSAAGQVFVDSAGTVYIGTWGGGLNRLTSSEGRFERLNPDSPPLRIQTLFEDREGRLWVGDNGEGLVLFDGESSFRTARLPDGGLLERVWGLTQSADGRLWVAAGEGLYELDGETLELTRTEALDADHPRALAATESHLWIGGNAGLYSMSLETGAVRRLDVELPTINVLRVSPSGRLLIGTLAGLFAVDPSVDALVPPVGGANVRLFPDRNIRDIDFDRTGIIWLATREAGVIKLQGRRTGFEGYATDEQLETVDTLVELTPDELLIGSRRGLWRLHREGDGPHLDHIPGSGSLFVNHLARGGGRVFVSARSGLRLYDPVTRSLVDDSRFAGLEGISVTVVHPARDGSLWVGTWAEGLFHLPADGGEMVRYWTGGTPSLPDDYISLILPDEDGGLWLGHWYEGLSRLSPSTGEIERFDSRRDDASALPAGHVHSAVVDGGVLWVGTSFGFARLDLDSRQLTRIPISRLGLPTSVQRLELDQDGNVWIASSRGVKRFDPSTGRIVHYGVADGLVATEFYARSGARGRLGTLYFGGVGGLVSFDPRNVVDSFSVPDVFVTAVEIDGEPVAYSSGQVQVPAGTRELRVEFAAADFKDPLENRYQYRLLGEDEQWSAPTTENVVGFAALPAGDYRFELRAGNSNGVWSRQRPVALAVTVVPHWWETVWGIAALVAALAGLVYSGVLTRTVRIRAANRRLEAEVERQTRDLTRANERLAVAASTDFLTGLPNRRGFLEVLEKAEVDLSGTVALADVDNFKALNDCFGHDRGDQVLREVAEAVRASVRPGDVAARWGGEEFILFFAEVDMDLAGVIAERVRQAVEAVAPPSQFEGRSITITVGLAERQPAETLDQCIHRADRALYAGKQAGKNRVNRAPRPADASVSSSRVRNSVA